MPEQNTEKPPEEKKDLSEGKGGKQILIVEDEPTLMMALSEKLKNNNYNVLQAKNGAEAIEVAKKDTPKVILLDIIMPMMDGFATLQGLRKLPNLKDTKIIFLTNLGQTEDVERGKNLGADDYLIKANYSTEQIVAKINKYL